MSKRRVSNQNHARKGQMTDVLPSLRKDLQNAKLFLQQRSKSSGDSLYDHLSRVISKVIDERPKNIVDYFELFSERVRVGNFQMQEMKLDDAYKEPERLDFARQRLSVLISKSQRSTANVHENEKNESSQHSTESIANGDDELDEDEEEQNDVIYEAAMAKDLCELQFYWNLFGIGFPREEVFSLSFAIRQLKRNASIDSCRFWGKIFGLQNDYYVVECTLTMEEKERRIDAIEKTINIMNLEPSSGATSLDISEQNRKSSIVTASKVEERSGDMESSSSKDNGSDVDANKYPLEWNFSMNIPESSYLSPIEMPSEEIGHGINRCVYFVRHNVSDGEWVELPSVTPHQINVSRRMMKYLTGNLDAEILSYPTFPGSERNYLRALIARISAGTHVAPRNFYKLGASSGDEEEDEDEFEDEDICNNDKPITVNASYRPLSREKLLKLDNFVHVKPEILKQGRVCFFDGKSLLNNGGSQSDVSNNDGDDDVSGSDVSNEANNNIISPEMPVPLFAPCSRDRLTNDIASPWTIRVNDVVDSSLVLLKSNVWPGAYAFAVDRICDNIYIGYGHKNSTLNYSPPALPQMKMECDTGADIEEIFDPSVEDEQEAANKKLNENHKDSSDEVELNENQ